MTDNYCDSVSVTVAKNITALRRKHGWTLRDVSDRTAHAGKRVGISTLSRVENARDGHRTVVVSVDDLVALAAAFEVGPEELLTEQPVKCAVCLDSPPPGFACRTCHAEA